MDVIPTLITSPAVFGAATPVELDSYWSLFMQADIVVKLVMIGLILASIASWAIVVNKLITLRILNKQATDFEETFWTGRTLEDLSESLGEDPRDPMGRVFSAASREWKESKSRPLNNDAEMIGARERIDRIMTLVINRELAQAEKGLGTLATIASAAPFVGLFGTVWGIMNSFRSISAMGDADLVTVGPGMSEALLATGLGLFAAIPALIFYNKFSGDIAGYAARLEGFPDELSAILSRKLGGRSSR